MISPEVIAKEVVCEYLGMCGNDNLDNLDDLDRCASMQRICSPMTPIFSSAQSLDFSTLCVDASFESASSVL